MRKIKQRLTAVLLLCALCFLYACENVVDFQETESGIYDEETGITYLMSNWAVQPIKLEGVYGKYNKVSLYAIQFEDTANYLADTEMEDIGFVYRNASLPDFTMETFNPVAALIYVPGATSLFVERWNAEKKYLDEEYQNVEGLRDDSEYVYAVRDAIISGEEAVLPGTNDIDHDYDYHIRLLSPDYPGLYYLIAFYRDLNGKTYLYDRGSKKTVLCPQPSGGFMYARNQADSPLPYRRGRLHRGGLSGFRLVGRAACRFGQAAGFLLYRRIRGRHIDRGLFVLSCRGRGADRQSGRSAGLPAPRRRPRAVECCAGRRAHTGLRQNFTGI